MLIAVLLSAFVLAAVGFWLCGGRWFVVRTPSMGTAAPVGTLVLTRPVAVADLQVGEVISFHPPTAPHETFTHRIVTITGDGITTRGDINGASDPWQLRSKDIIGRAVMVVPGLGWLIRAVPLLSVGSLLLWMITRRFVASWWRGQVQLVGTAALFLLVSSTMRPWVGIVQLATTTDERHTSISAVSTGILPIRISAVAGHGTARPLDLRYGGTGVVRVENAPHGGGYALGAHLHLGWVGWAVAIAFCLLPLAWTVLVGFRPGPRPALPFAVLS